MIDTEKLTGVGGGNGPLTTAVTPRVAVVVVVV